MFDGFDMGQLMAQAQKLQEDLLQAQEDLAAQSFTASFNDSVDELGLFSTGVPQ